MVQAVDTIHEARIVHSDLKPANFLMVEGVLKLIDFGIAKAISSDTTSIARESQVGTLNYMSPEAILGGQNNIRGCGPMKVCPFHVAARSCMGGGRESLRGDSCPWQSVPRLALPASAFCRGLACNNVLLLWYSQHTSRHGDEAWAAGGMNAGASIGQ